jgi:hypothetical protein
MSDQNSIVVVYGSHADAEAAGERAEEVRFRYHENIDAR